MHDTSDAPALLTGVATTSLLISALRAAEAGRPGALFDDPLAQAVVAAVGDGDAARAWVDADGAPTPINLALSQYVAVRTRYFDDSVERAVADGIRQVVILGSGMDGRSMRLALPPETTFFEVDHGDVLAAKRRVLSGAQLTVQADVRPVAADLSRPAWPSALIAEGYDPAAPAIWLAEGLLYYLSQDGCARLLRAISDLCVPGSRLAAEFPEGDARVALHSVGDPRASQSLGSWLGGGPQRSPTAWLHPAGWAAEPIRLVEVCAALARPAPAWSVQADGSWWFTRAVRESR